MSNQKNILVPVLLGFILHEKSVFLICLPRFQVKPLFWLDAQRFFMQNRVVDMSKAHFQVRFMTIFVFRKNTYIYIYMAAFFYSFVLGLLVSRVCAGGLRQHKKHKNES